MKPLQLKMQAFGPYVQMQTVDFEKLAENHYQITSLWRCATKSNELAVEFNQTDCKSSTGARCSMKIHLCVRTLYLLSLYLARR